MRVREGFLIYDDVSKGMRTSVTRVDKRHFPRMEAVVTATCEKDDLHAPDAYGYFHSCSKDLSATGARFVVGQGVNEGEHFRIALELPDSLSPLLIECEVVWVKPLEKLRSKLKEAVEVGVRFVKLDSPHDDEKLRDYLKSIQ